MALLCIAVLLATAVVLPPAVRPMLPARPVGLLTPPNPIPIHGATRRGAARVPRAQMAITRDPLGRPQYVARGVILLFARCVGAVAMVLGGLGSVIMAVANRVEDWKHELNTSGHWLAGE
jgi:hypothetical protein